MRWFGPLGKLGILAAALALLFAGIAAAELTGLPTDFAQVNDDPAAGIDPSQDAGFADVTGGSLSGAARLPWATFEQKSGSAQRIFVRVFKNGAWVTQGPTLNIDRSVVAQAPAIDFAGPHRTVPWSSWFEPNATFGGKKQIFASRFCAATNALCAAANTWVPEGQDRGSALPSLNINTDRDAEDPSVAGGATVAGNDPVPWVVWREQDGAIGGATHEQTFVSKGVKQGAARQPCTGFTPSSAATLGFFCWQQVGLGRLAKDGGAASGGDPTLNIDPSRDTVSPDIGFTGPNDTVGWVVWYEEGPSAFGLRTNQQIFAAKLVADASADGGFHWQAVGSGTAGQTNVLDNSGPNSIGPCGASTANEDACSLNAVATNDAQDPRVASGTLTPGQATVPWVVWSEQSGARSAIFIARLVAGNHFELFNGGKPLSNTGHDASNPDITFFGNIPYVSWSESIAGENVGFVGHFDGSAFLLDTPGGIRRATGGPVRLLDDARVPISSSCTADPFTSDGSSCPGGAPDAPFELFTSGDSPQALFAAAEGPCTIIVGCNVAVRVRNGRAQVVARLGLTDPVGILVQRIVGQRRVHGRVVRRVKTVGRVPFGRKRHGGLRVRWNLRVRGHRLGPGRYLVTLRAFNRRHRVIATSRPVLVVIR